MWHIVACGNMSQFPDGRLTGSADWTIRSKAMRRYDVNKYKYGKGAGNLAT
ncbi:hypothetical protein SAMN05216404_101350 [Nitrosospira multiformis]|uniref:Uncharacterized protein n=1 Tax=Nitrosospira multiformis TaxID=1231 RepID=A0A1H8BTX0_9PROT|nr:hypothetical protein SAMN05216404_101350 [Nitrosospira multiformis]